MSWVLEDNINSLGALERGVAMDKYKTYRLYETPLETKTKIDPA
jgi:hypothetical protein